MDQLELLQEEKESLKKQLAEASENYKTLETLSLEQAEKLENEVVSLKAENEVLVAVNQELTSKVEELSQTGTLGAAGEKAGKEPKPALPTETFEVDGKKFKFITPVFVHNRQRVTAAQALNDTALLAQLVSMGSGVITEA